MAEVSSSCQGIFEKFIQLKTMGCNVILCTFGDVSAQKNTKYFLALKLDLSRRFIKGPNK